MKKLVPKHEDEPDDQNRDSQPLTSSQVHAAFSDSAYLLASVIFQNSRREKPAATRQLVRYGQERELPLPPVKDEMRRPAFELAFNTLRYQELLEDVIIDSGFFSSPHIPDDQMSLFAVMLYDFQDRKFIPQDYIREDFIQEVRDVENYLIRCKTKLEASLARYRIKHDLSSFDCILPEIVKVKQERANRLPLYAWVNALTSSLDEVQSALTSLGLSRVNSVRQLEGQTFCQDPHCEDVLVFPARMKAKLDGTELLSERKLIVQDKSCSLAPNVAISLLPEEADVLLVGSFSGLTVSHAASLIHQKQKTDKNKSRVLACVGGLTDFQREAVQQVVVQMGCKKVKLIYEVFRSLTSGDKRLAKVRLILLTPNCSLSAVSNPLQFLLHENRDAALLQDLSQGSVAQSKLEALIAQQREDIDHALKFPQTLAVVYATCSSHPEENEQVVTGAVERARATSQQEWRLRKNELRQSQSHTSSERREENFFRVEPSDLSNGCFLAVLSREVNIKPKHSMEEASPTAQARLHTGSKTKVVRSKQPIRKKKRRQTVKSSKADFAHPTEQQISDKKRSIPHGTPPKFYVQAPKHSVGASPGNQENGSFVPSKPGKNQKANTVPIFSTPTSTLTLRPTPAPATLAIRPRMVHQLALKPAVIIMPPQLFPPPPRPHPRLLTWRTPAPSFPSSGTVAAFSKDTPLKHKLKFYV
ncbi:putative methyltransferase NSUN7 [Corythoichthys intestinalis]|uniref:putative methyltransferase NSUN7 n=1 Tax=Corythoichthys intestinalis TaxID=161448 RepID=UPI0025A5B25A|nr:putative methyltransferase NSUN7 [Corythoichthys intestinalis]